MDPTISICSYSNISSSNNGLYTYPNKPPVNRIILKTPISYVPFINLNSIVLANLDMVFNFTKQLGGYIMTQDYKDFKFLVIDDAPGGFAEYLLFRNPNGYGFGTLSDNTKYSDKLDRSRFKIINQKENPIKVVNNLFVEGLDLVVGSIIGTDLYIGLETLKIGATFICPVFESDLYHIYISSLCFDKITLFRPIADGKVYLVAENMKVNNIDVLESYDKITIKDDFRDWVNNYFQSDAIISYDLDIYKCKAIWNLPRLS